VTFFISILGLLLLVFIHECGHFFTAIAVGIRPRKFYVGFPPAIAKVNRKGIEFGIGAIPLGGYVRIPGMHRPAPRDIALNLGPALKEAPQLTPYAARVERALEQEDHATARKELPALEREVEAADLSRLARKGADRALRDLDESLGEDAYWRARTWKRVAVIAAGPGVNILAAIILLSAVYMVGIPAANSRHVDAVEAGTPAAAAGLQKGDVVVAVNGRPTPTFTAVRARIQASHGKPIAVTVERAGRRVQLPPEATIRQGSRWLFGFQPGVTTKSYGLGSALRLAADDTWQTVKGMGLAIAGLFHKKDRGQLHSAVGIVRISSAALKVSIAVYLQLLAFISLSLAVLNLLPLLPLDGGHILFSLIEGVRGRAVAREVYERASVVGLALILLIAFIAFSNDLSGHSPG
jgi:regulator of sigma E protease